MGFWEPQQAQVASLLFLCSASLWECLHIIVVIDKFATCLPAVFVKHKIKSKYKKESVVQRVDVVVEEFTRGAVHRKKTF